MNQCEIDRELYKIKKWYQQNYPLCGYCAHLVRGEGDLSHFIRRSYSRELQTNKLNVSLCHRSCHDIFDNDYEAAVFLPRIIEVLYIIWILDQQYFNQISGNFEPLSDILARFPEVPEQKLSHHGELLQLQYLLIADSNI